MILTVRIPTASKTAALPSLLPNSNALDLRCRLSVFPIAAHATVHLH